MKTKGTIMRRLLLSVALVIAVLLPSVPADAQDCRSHTYHYPAGKTAEGFQANATDGCNAVDWTGSIGQGPGGGTLTFKTVDAYYTWQSGGALPGPEGGDANACTSRAVQEANAYFNNLFHVPTGTEVTVTYRCD